MINKIKLLSKLGWYKMTQKYANSSQDYDKASGDYDTFFSDKMGRHSIQLLNKLDIKPGQDVLELACGTGFITNEIAKRLEGSGSITTVDQSQGMLEVAKAKLSSYSTLKLNMQQNDMMRFLGQTPDCHFNTVVCGWAICYTNPVQFMREVNRVLKPNGQVGIIETRIDSEELLMTAFEKVLSNDPSYLRRYINIKLPSNSDVLKRWFLKGDLNTTDLWEGEQPIPCVTSEDALEWILRSGAAAGFLDVIDRTREQEMLGKIKEELDRTLLEEKKLRLSHTYVAGVASKEIS
ncbi:class I SAM-dependent methyltransferase [Paenibacillus faecalis]|uniref:class I SAM-dependent methyltransferase n=1 Tax=Paenibacillus faecalis TaxID=2079532 RepID=UPI000D110B69|nr:class I SAM-dependent methyltransferase [Paenibacillus faecalis]